MASRASGARLRPIPDIQPLAIDPDAHHPYAPARTRLR
jgi:hypothetical protein